MRILCSNAAVVGVDMKPRISILKPEFRYRNAASTDVRRTWANAKRRLALEAEAERAAKVTPIKRKA